MKELPGARLFLLAAALAAACTGKYVRPTTLEKIDASPERLARGGYLVNSIMSCGACHTPRVDGSVIGGERADAYLAGGLLFDDRENSFRISVPNITPDPATGIGAWSDDELMRAIRDGVDRQGRLMRPPMPFYMYDELSDDDLRAVVAYLRSIPPASNNVERVAELPFMFRMAMKFGVMHHKPRTGVVAPPTSDRVAYGRYLARLGACTDCHSMTSRGPDEKDNLLAGSKEAMSDPAWGKVYARNLTPDPETGLGTYGADQIKDALRSGKRLDGKPMAPPMTWLIPHVSTWTDEDLDALVAFLQSVPAKKAAIPERALNDSGKKVVGE
jgi:mono/diheme cytochrome c family protein